MATYQIYYELRNKKEYDEFQNRIRKYRGFANYGKTWFISTDQNVQQVYDHLMAAIDCDDPVLIVTELKGPASWFGTSEPFNKALKSLL